MKIYSICKLEKRQVYDFHLDQWLTILPEDDDIVNNHIMTAGEAIVALSRLQDDPEEIEILEYLIENVCHVQGYTAKTALESHKRHEL